MDFETRNTRTQRETRRNSRDCYFKQKKREELKSFYIFPQFVPLLTGGALCGRSKAQIMQFARNLCIRSLANRRAAEQER